MYGDADHIVWPRAGFQVPFGPALERYMLGPAARQFELDSEDIGHPGRFFQVADKMEIIPGERIRPRFYSAKTYISDRDTLWAGNPFLIQAADDGQLPFRGYILALPPALLFPLPRE